MNKKFTISVRTIVRVLFAVLFTASCVANIYLASENANLSRVKDSYKRANLFKQHELDSLNKLQNNEPRYPAIEVVR